MRMSSMMRVNLSTEKSPAANCIHSKLSGWARLPETTSSHLCVDYHERGEVDNVDEDKFEEKENERVGLKKSIDWREHCDNLVIHRIGHLYSSKAWYCGSHIRQGCLQVDQWLKLSFVQRRFFTIFFFFGVVQMVEWAAHWAVSRWVGGTKIKPFSSKVIQDCYLGYYQRHFMCRTDNIHLGLIYAHQITHQRFHLDNKIFLSQSTMTVWFQKLFSKSGQSKNHCYGACWSHQVGSGRGDDDHE